MRRYRKIVATRIIYEIKIFANHTYLLNIPHVTDNTPVRAKPKPARYQLLTPTIANRIEATRIICATNASSRLESQHNFGSAKELRP
jgi:hypothetical protein